MSRHQFLLVGVSLGFAIVATPGTSGALPDDTERWIQVDTERFQLASNASVSTTRKIGVKLEQLAAVLEETTEFKTTRSAVPCRIIIFKDEESFGPYKLRSDGKPDSVAGYFVSSPASAYLAIDGSAKDEALRTTYHEFIHLLVHLQMPYIPLWLNEGLAEFYSTAKIKGRRAEVGLTIENHRYWLANHRFIGTAHLFAMDTESSDYVEGPRRQVFYAQSWLLTHYLLNGSRTGKQSFRKLLPLLRQGKGSAEAIATAYALDINDLEQDLRAYLEQKWLNYYELKLTGKLEASEMHSRALSRQEVLYLLGDLLLHRPPLQESAAEEHLTAALALDPHHGRCHLSLGLLRDELGRTEDASASFREAIELQPEDPIFHLCCGRHLLNRVANEKNLKDGERFALLDRAQEQFQQAIALDPQNADAQIGLGRVYRARGVSAPEAVTALTVAMQLRPWDLEALGDLIVLQHLDGNRDGAYRMARGLEARAGDKVTRAVERQLASADAQDAFEMANDGDHAGATMLLRDTAERVGDPALQAQIAKWLSEIEESAREHADVEQYNRACDAANARKYKLAAAIFDSVAAGAVDPTLREQAKEAADRIRKRGR